LRFSCGPSTYSSIHFHQTTTAQTAASSQQAIDHLMDLPQQDISILHKTGHFYFALTLIFKDR